MNVIADIKREINGETEHTVLTPTFLYQIRKKWGVEKEVYIPLLHLSSISFSYTAPVSLLVFASLLLVAGIFGYNYEIEKYDVDPKVILWLGIAAFIILVGLFFIGRRQSLIMASNSDKVEVYVKGRNKKPLKDFINKVHSQQAELLKSLAQQESSNSQGSQVSMRVQGFSG